MRILFISRYLPFPGGRENFVYELISELKKEHEVGLITPDGLVANGFQVYKYKDDLHYIANIIKQFNPNIINSHTFYLCEHALKVSRELSIPFVFTIHGDQFVIGDKKRQNLVKKVSSESDSVVTVCNDGKRSLLRNTRIPEDKISVIYNGINNNKFSNDKVSELKTHLRRMYGLPENRFIFLIPARMVWYKGLGVLVKAIELKSKQFTNKKGLFLISIPSSSLSGEEIEYMDELLDDIKRKDLFGLVRIIFADYNFMPILYRLSDAYILSSLSEQFPISMLEAFASEIPVLCSDIGGISEVVLDSINGYLVNANDPQALADKAYHILLDPDEIRVIVKKAKLLALRKYSIANTAEQYIDLFKTLLRIKR